MKKYHHHGDFHGTKSSKRKISLLLVPVKTFYEPYGLKNYLEKMHHGLGARIENAYVCFMKAHTDPKMSKSSYLKLDVLGSRGSHLIILIFFS